MSDYPGVDHVSRVNCERPDPVCPPPLGRLNREDGAKEFGVVVSEDGLVRGGVGAIDVLLE